MKDNDLTTQSKSSRSFTQEMQQAFVDLVKQLPSIRRDILKDPEREDLREGSADQASPPHPTDGALTGRSPDKDGRHR
jgi:hypothetical protein